MKKLLLFLSLFIFHFSFAQDSCHLRISLLTCAPGEELYSTFGHTAIRVTDSVNGTDQVFNYGTFQFGPDFYTKFIRGKLLYFLSIENFSDFMYQYQMESRSVQEQVINLSCSERQQLTTALFTNSLEQNRYYRYDFLFDNCTTRAKDIIAKNTAQQVVFNNILPKNVPSFRDLIHSYLDSGHQYWSKLGIDMLLGAKLDRKVTNEQAMFLPDYLLKGFDHAAKGQQKLVAQKQTILQMPSPLSEGSVFTPAVIFSFLLVCVIVLSITNKNRAQQTLHVFDFLFFFLLGIAGVIMLFMWFGTDHTVCANNYNLLWALPTHFIAAFFVGSKKQWTKKYFTVAYWVTILLLAAWFFLPQEMNHALIPIVLLLLFRTYKLSKA